MADLNAKDGSQETMVNLIALLINLTMLPWLPSYPGVVYYLEFFSIIFVTKRIGPW